MIETTKSDRSGISVPGEVTLMDVWFIVRAYRVLIIVLVGVFTLAGAVLAFAMPPQHRFTTAVEIGDQFVNDEIIPIETANTVIAKLRDSFIPSVIARQNGDVAGGPGDYVFQVTGSGESQVVKITSEGSRQAKLVHVTLHRHITDALTQDHDRTANTARDRAAFLLAQAESELIQLKAEEEAAAEQVDLLNTAIASMKIQLGDTVGRIFQLEEKLSALADRADAASVTQALLLSQQIGAMASLRADLDEKVRVSLPVAQSNVRAQVAILAQKKETARSAIQYRRAEPQNIQATRVLGDGTTMSASSVSPGKTVVILVSLIVGAAVAIGLALVMDFIAKARSSPRA